MCNRFVAYYRVSTQKQGKSGLGLEAQQAAVASYVAGKGTDAKLLAAYTEVESGKRNDRPALLKAMEHARLTNSRLVIAKLDRLSRNAAFLLGLQDSGVKFVAADLPEANEMVVGMMAVIAQAERKMISDRTKAALQAARARGTKLGNPNGAKALHGFGNGAAIDAVKTKADDRAKGLKDIVANLQEQGFTSANAIASELNRMEIATARGGKWSAKQVIRVVDRLA